MSRLVRALRRLPASDVPLLMRMTGWALLLPLLKRLLPLPALVRFACVPPGRAARDRDRERHVAALVRRLYGSPLVRDENCLERSLLLYRLLGRLNASPDLVTGVRRDEDGVVGHAWVAVDGEPVGEARESIDGFEVILSFDARSRLREPIRAAQTDPTGGT